MARPLRPQFEGALYHVVVRANNRQPLFRTHRDRWHYLSLVTRYRGQFAFKVYAYLLIKRQVHLVIETPRGNVSKVMQCLGTSYTSYFNRRYRRRGTLFEGRYRSYLIENKSYLPAITGYLHRNHFQCDLKMEKKRDCPWSSYCIYLGRRASDLVETETVLGHFGRGTQGQRKRYQEFVERRNTRQDTYLKEVESQQIMGTKEFVRVSTHPRRSQTNSGKDSLREAERILHELSKSLGSKEAAELRQRRSRALARYVAMYLIRRQTSLSLRCIGELLGVKAPAVALGIGKVERLLKREDFCKRIKRLLRDSDLSSSKVPGGVYP